MSEQLEFIDEYPMVSESRGEDGNATWADPFYSIQDAFARLPEAKVPKPSTNDGKMTLLSL